jgi:hypothetical protein
MITPPGKKNLPVNDVLAMVREDLNSRILKAMER